MGAAIKVENLGKKYILSHKRQERYTALRDVMAESLKRVGKRIVSPFSSRNETGPAYEEFWALKGVSLEIKQGDRVGIIGRNGAGKSTLLKILSRITEPTTGRFSLKGRAASLLEVGTGFHPELTGRENIFLNGSVLGMGRAEILRKFDEIVSFAEIEKFLDTPVKRYSSGMYVRLAFAVAAHLEPEILIVDEVLAVGDAQFQKKCLGKMQDVSTKEGRTVLFVSHNMNAVEQLCTSAVLLERGQIRKYDTDVGSVIKDYLFGAEDNEMSEWVNPGKAFENPWFKPLKFYLADSHGCKLTMPVSNNKEVWINIEAEITELDPALTVGYAIYAEDGILLYWSYQTDESEENWPRLQKGRGILRSMIPRRFLNEGTYKIELIGGLHFREWLFEPGVKAPYVFMNIKGGLSDSPCWMIKRPGLLAPVFKWRSE